MNWIDDSPENTAAHRLDPPLAQPPEMDDDLGVLLLEPGDHLVFADGDSVRVHTVLAEWTRIGRSASSEIRFEDPTVSRRHALLVRRPDGLKVVDDRSLNGVCVNGERVDIHTLSSGDTIQVGRHALHFVRVTVTTPLADALPVEALQV
ncbi:MAG: FHA domain-containing protein [Solirubrobacterales bacterium]